jgi:thiosulfate/3-mercaptopyruvate sulfurtransferase
MTYTVLITAAELQALRAQERALVLLDCSFDLAEPAAGEAAYAHGHLPGAQYVHLDRDLCGAKTGRNGRHPLPARDAFAARAGEWGVAPGVQVVSYDNQGGMYAARAWWLLRWLGHGAVAVLNGGRAAWLRDGAALDTAAPTKQVQAPYPVVPHGMGTLSADELQRQLGQVTLLDARAPERWRGDVEPLDPVAGHIPGSNCRFFKLNLAEDGCFKAPEQLRKEFLALGASGAVVHQCGSGVTACHNLLAMAHAGLEPGALYPGSWSEWCSDPARPVARG